MKSYSHIKIARTVLASIGLVALLSGAHTQAASITFVGVTYDQTDFADLNYGKRGF